MPSAVRESTLAAVAVELASVLDGMPGARDAASVAKELRATMAELKTMADAAPEEADPIDELSRRRAHRISDSPVSDGAAGSGL
jgi:hypothetical protein